MACMSAADVPGGRNLYALAVSVMHPPGVSAFVASTKISTPERGL